MLSKVLDYPLVQNWAALERRPEYSCAARMMEGIEEAMEEDQHHTADDNDHGQKDDLLSLAGASGVGTGSNDDTVDNVLAEEAEVVLQHGTHVEPSPGAPCGYFCC